ncbi:MAG: H+-transporting two-sector ATPase, delta/epsilon subunit [Bacteroidota bacterium]|jgi:F-type H+-transporting ATPase subunit epsilon
MTLEIVSPEYKIFSGTVTSVAAPGVDGSFQILNNHAPIVSILRKGSVKIEADKFNFSKESQHLFEKDSANKYNLLINSGTLEMKDNKIIILVD